MKPNIDARGRALRWYSGILCSALGSVSVASALAGIVPYRWFLGAGVVLILAGLFQLFESRNGWCALRALGIRTPV